MAVLHPATGILNILKGVSGFTTGWGVWAGRMTPTPDKQFVLRSTGGPSGELAVALDYPTVQLLCRGAPGSGGFLDAWNKIQLAKESLVGIPSGGAYYPDLTSCMARGDIQDLGYDDKDRPLFSLNLALIVSYDSSGYRDALLP